MTKPSRRTIAACDNPELYFIPLLEKAMLEIECAIDSARNMTWEPGEWRAVNAFIIEAQVALDDARAEISENLYL